MLSGATSISRGFPAIQVLKLASNRQVSTKSPEQASSDDVVLAAVTNPPRIGDVRPISALMPDVLARYGLTAADALRTTTVNGPRVETLETSASIDVSV